MDSRHLIGKSSFSIKKIDFLGIRIKKLSFLIEIWLTHENSRIVDQNARFFDQNAGSFNRYVTLGGGVGGRFCYKALWKLWEEGRGLRWYRYITMVKISHDASQCCRCLLHIFVENNTLSALAKQLKEYIPSYVTKLCNNTTILECIVKCA